MGGKGIRRREKNYEKAHGGKYKRLPPPPKSSEIDALPSKLRKLMEFTSPKPTIINNNNDIPHSESKPRSSKEGGDTERNNMGKKKGTGSDKKPTSKEGVDSKPARFSEDGDDDKIVTPKQEDSGDEDVDKDDKKNRKRKRKQVNDLRFEALQGRTKGLKRKERKKKYLEAKKNKHKKGKIEDDMLGFQGHEKIRFGDVVEAPPKLNIVPKASKPVQAAFQERLRLQAVEAYRNRKKWVSRPGLQIPAAEIPNPSV